MLIGKGHYKCYVALIKLIVNMSQEENWMQISWSTQSLSTDQNREESPPKSNFSRHFSDSLLHLSSKSNYNNYTTRDAAAYVF